MSNIRWLVIEKRIISYDERDEPYVQTIGSKPVLQELINNEWVNVPTIIQKEYSYTEG